MRVPTHFLAALAASLTITAALAGAGPCPGDVNGDGVTDVQDLTLTIVAWGSDDEAADLNDDGIVNVLDLTGVIVNWGCEAPDNLTTLSGIVSNQWTGQPIEGATVTVGEETLLTDAGGAYSGLFMVGQHEITFAAEHYNGQSETIILFPGLPAELDALLEPVAPVVVTVEVSGDSEPDGTAIATAIVTVLDGFSNPTGFSWTQVGGPPAQLSGTNTDTLSLQLGSLGAYKTRLLQVLAEPPIGPDELPPNVPPPPGEFPAGIQNRFQVVGLNPFALEETGLIVVEVAVTTISGTYGGEGEVHTLLPWRPTAGIRNVPVNVPVLFHGKDQASYNWALAHPPASQATLLDATTQDPQFTPDVAGVYTVTVTNQQSGSPVSFTIYAGNWQGVVTGQDAEGFPVADATCVICHQNLGADEFTPWYQTGHAKGFAQGLDTNTHFGPQCFSCHSVGYDPSTDNGGIDEAADYQDFLESGLIGQTGDNFTTMLEQFPSTALLANVQCENCHGPQWGLPGVSTLAHGPINPMGEPRVSLAADVCATCHGEPRRHARFQQWQISADANYELAIEEGTNGSCARCHTVNGFLAWLPILTGEVPGDPLASIPVTWTADEVHPQTCVTCHDPHSTGTTSGIDTDATVRISGNTPPLIAGFTAYGVGRGAICMTCHNTRRGLHNDATFPDVYGTTEAARSPHQGAQADMLMGENAFLVPVGIRGNHSFLTDTCVRCHMEETPPPDLLSYNQSGTNHTFYASNTICVECHTGFDGPAIQAGVAGTLQVLQDAIEAGLLDLIAEQTGAGNIIDLNGLAQITDAEDVEAIVFSESGGQHAMTVTLAGLGTFGPLRMNDVDVLSPSMMNLGILYNFAEPELIKAGWNWCLVDNDGSMGVHNPSFAYQMMGAGISALNPGAAATIDWPTWMTTPPPPSAAAEAPARPWSE